MYYIGQKVVCVKSYGTDPRLIEGQIYRVLDIWSCCSVINLDVGLTHSVGTHCLRCGKQKLDGVIVCNLPHWKKIKNIIKP